MRLLIDESLSARLTAPLAAAGHDVVHVTDLSLLGEPDEVVLSAALEDDRILVTADTDFGALLALSGATFPSVVLLRRGGRKVEQRAQQISVSLELAEHALNMGALVVAEHTRLRIRELPIERSSDEGEWRTI
jgi:predicted nuclease of predicted toxin-antitoxin system